MFIALPSFLPYEICGGIFGAHINDRHDQHLEQIFDYKAAVDEDVLKLCFATPRSRHERSQDQRVFLYTRQTTSRSSAGLRNFGMLSAMSGNSELQWL